MRIFINSWFQKFLAKHRINARELGTAIKLMESGRVDADLGGGVFKQRLAQSGQGKSASVRSIVCYRKSERAFLYLPF